MEIKHPISCVLVDDEPIALEYMDFFIQKMPELGCKGSFTNALEALKFIQSHKIELAFLDIQMPQLTGVELAGFIHSETGIIFTTAYPDYAVEGFNLNAIDYLLKPIAYARFQQAVQKAVQRLRTSNEGEKTIERDFLLVKVDYKWIKIYFKDILYIEGLKEYVKIVTKDNAFVTLESMKNMEVTLSKEGFLRTHKSFIINLSYVTAWYGSTIELGRIDIPIGATYKEEVMAKLI